MPNCATNKNPLQRSGTSQQQRQLPGMLPDYVLIDEKRYSDWIVFATEFSKYLKYYDTATGAVTGNWQPFFSSDISALLGTVAVQNIETYRTHIKERINFIKDNENEGSENKLKSTLNELFSAVFTLAKALDDTFIRLTDEVAIKSGMQQLIKVKLAPAYRRLVAYYYGAKEESLIRKIDDEDTQWQILGTPLTEAATVLETNLSSVWWTDDIQSPADIEADKSVFGNESWTNVFRRVSHAGNHYLFASAFDIFTGTYTRIIADAEKQLLTTLESFDTHAPHYALFLTFLKLFRELQAQINTITWRHLDYYYKEILRLKPKEAIPDQIHLVAELAKHIDSASLAEGTLFKAGKDSAGKEVVYALDDETTFNKAEVAAFKAVYKGSAAGDDDIKNSGGTITVNNKKRLYASPVMNSADGIGKAIKNENGEWHPMVNKTFNEEGSIADINMPVAEIGFALASHYLFLAEGVRKIRVRLDIDESAITTAGFRCLLTTEKEWLEITPTSIAAATFSGNAQSCKEIVVDIPATAPAITAYDAKVHGGSFNVDVPVIKFILVNNEDTSTYGYDALKNITISQTEIKVEVGGITNSFNQDGIKQLLLANQNGTLDASKPYQPYGTSPETGMSFVIGNKELFTKKNAAFNLHLEWLNRPSITSPNGTLQVLKGSKWHNVAASFTGSQVCQSSTHAAFTSLINVDANAIVDYKDEYSNYNTSSRAGFVRIALNNDFGHSTYLNTLTLYLIDQAKEEPTGSPSKPTQPYTPTIKSLYLSYAACNDTASLTTVDEDNFKDRDVQFFHVGPFGEAERNANISEADKTIYLLPHFDEVDTPLKDENDETIQDFAAAFYIGIKNLYANQSVNILFQFLEGSTNPLVSKPDEHVYWSYLANNHWVAFDENTISDGTMQLINSGIISFAIPDDATTDNTILPTGYIWLKATVGIAADTVCEILSLQAQAMIASYLPNNNATDFLDTALPAGTVSKLKSPNSSFKKISQPYSSFGGRQTESNSMFYLRSSERLRHKGRAITIWDYEHLVLEAFPQLHKVKCLNHTQIEDSTDAAASIYNETRPGHVSIITIPNMVNRNDANPLKPYTNQNLLTEINDYLAKRVSGHVNLHLCNPLFEEVRLEFKLQLREDYDDFTYYSGLLQQAITEYLAPWAFNQVVEVQFGGKISKSQLINFIEEQYYVDFITDVKLFHKPGNNVAELPGDFEEVSCTTARSILVSAPASKHLINVYEAPETVAQKECDSISD